MKTLAVPVTCALLALLAAGALLVQAADGSLADGSAGLVTYKAAAAFDDYVAYQPW